MSEQDAAGTAHSTGGTDRCNHCGMPLDAPTLDGSCPHCADIYPHTEPHADNAVRCDGCGSQRADMNCMTYKGDGNIQGTYCRGCREILRETWELEPGEHEQYALMDDRTLSPATDHSGGDEE